MHLKTTGIDHLNLSVINLEESCVFYEKLLGFKVLEEFSEQRGRIIGTHEAKLALYESAEMQKETKSGLSHIGFHIKNFSDIETKCHEMGITIKYDGVTQWPKSRSIYIEDPNGYELELAEVWGGNIGN